MLSQSYKYTKCDTPTVTKIIGGVFFMGSKILKQIKVVEASNGARFQELYNKTAEELEEADVEVEIQHKSTGHCAYFMYTVNIPDKKTLSDLFREVGITHRCYECPYLNIGTDARRRSWDCLRSGYKAYMDSEMCEEAYRDLAEGKMVLRGKGDQDDEDDFEKDE
jgi:hypothetical protein